MNRFLLTAATLAVPALPIPVTAQTSVATPAAYAAELNRAAIRRIGEAVARWHVAHVNDRTIATTWPRDNLDPRGWVQASGYIGLARWGVRARDQVAIDGSLAWSKANGWRPGDRRFDANDQAAGQVYAMLHAAKRAGSEALAPTRERLDAILAAPSKVALGWDASTYPVCMERWCWADALFMAPPTWFQLGKATGDRRYADFADREFWATTDFLFDKQEGLYYRDSRFFTERGPGGEKLFWSRGNGWVYAAVADILETLPAGDPRRPRYADLLRRMSVALKQTQHQAGHWSPSLLARGDVEEISGTAFFVFGMQRGIDLGILPRAEYAPVVTKAWRAIARNIAPDGRVRRVQQIGEAPTAVAVESTQLYGSGAVLLAASALYESAR